MSSKVISTVKDGTAVALLLTGYAYANYAALSDSTAPSSFLAYPIYLLGKTLSEKMILDKEVPSFLKSHIRDINGNEVRSIFNTSEFNSDTLSFSDLPKICTRAVVSSAGGLIYLLSRGIDKCAQAFSTTFLPDQLQQDLNLSTATQKEMLEKIAGKEGEAISNVKSLQEMQKQQAEQINLVQNSADQQGLVIKELEKIDASVLDPVLLEQYEASILNFIEQLGQLPSHEKRVELIKTLLGEIKTQESLSQGLEERLKVLAASYAEEAELIEELTTQIEQEILKV